MISRIDFDVSRPLVASAKLDCKGRHFEQRDPFPWRELGFDERGIIEMWMAGLVDHVADVTTEPVTVQMYVRPGERVDVRTPAKRHNQPRR